MVTSGGGPPPRLLRSDRLPNAVTTAGDPVPFTTDTGDNGMFDRLRSAPARVDLTPGAPDLGACPRAGWLRAERAVLQELSADAFGYPHPAGAPSFRRALAGWLARNRGLAVDHDEVIVVVGVAQAPALLARVLRAEGVDRPAAVAGSDVEIAETALAAGVKVHPLSWHRRRPGPSGLVLDYAASFPGEIAMGIEILARAVRGHR